MEDQLGALGLILNCVTLWNTVYLNAALEQLRSEAYPVLDTDVAHLRPTCAGTSTSTVTTGSWHRPAKGLRMLRDPDATEDLT